MVLISVPMTAAGNTQKVSRGNRERSCFICLSFSVPISVLDEFSGIICDLLTGALNRRAKPHVFVLVASD